MKQSGFSGIRLKLRLVKGNTIFGLREAFAYSANNWGYLTSTIAYIATFLIFVEAMFGRTNNLAGYQKNEVLLLVLMTQITFLIVFFISQSNIEKMGEMIRSGNLDLLLIKPLPHLWYLTWQRIDLTTTISNLVTSIFPVVIMLNKNGGVQLKWDNLVGGIIISIMGMVAVHCFQFMVNLSTFWTGQNKSILRLSYELGTFAQEVPWEGFPTTLKVIGISLIPSLINSALATSVMLGKSSYQGLIGYTLFLAAAMLGLKTAAWKEAIKHYQSASS
jgi:ABC-2 type transport system permease protein